MKFKVDPNYYNSTPLGAYVFIPMEYLKTDNYSVIITLIKKFEQFCEFMSSMIKANLLKGRGAKPRTYSRKAMVAGLLGEIHLQFGYFYFTSCYGNYRLLLSIYSLLGKEKWATMSVLISDLWVSVV